uniref:P-type domain-containing protein n=1 Tax=Parascaris univalens TaxID=6257 RepID=A0A914ZM23_PARUN
MTANSTDTYFVATMMVITEKRWGKNIVSNLTDGVMRNNKCDRLSQNDGQSKPILESWRTMLSLYSISITLIFAAVPIQCNALESGSSSTNLGRPSPSEFESYTEATSAAIVPGRIRPVKIKASEPGDDPRKRVNCFPQPIENVTELQRICITRGCIFDAEAHQSIFSAPQCYFPRNTGYALLDQRGSNTTMIYKKGTYRNPYGADIAFLHFSYSYNGATLCIHIGQSSRFEPPVHFPRLSSVSSDSFHVITANDSDVFSFSVQRLSTKTSIWDTSIGAFLFADNYIQIATLLPTDRIYGFGEHAHSSLKHDLSQYTTWGMLARNEAPDYMEKPLKNLYGVHPFYMGLEHDSMAHGVFILNSNAQEITTGPGPHLVYRTIGGNLDIHFFPGPKPEHVVQQYQAFIGTPLLPSYYSLGFQISRSGYGSASELETVVNNVSSAGILFDVININMDYMNESRDFTLAEGWTELENVSQNLHKDGYRITLLFNAAISVTGASFRRALLKNVSFVEWPIEGLVQKEVNSLYEETNHTKVMLGVGWPNEHVAFPDFLDTTSQTNDWWSDELQLFNKSAHFDGVWLDMNEPSSFGTNEQQPSYNDVTPLSCPLSGAFSSYDNPPFKTANAYYYGNHGELSSKTLCMIATTGGGNMTFYNTKNLYGLQQSVATFKALNGNTRQILVSRSTFPSSGRYTGHCFSGNSSGWVGLRGSIIAAQEFNLFGIPYVGSYICGDNSSLDDVELCVRWYQLGAFYSLSSDIIYKDSPSKDPIYNKAVAVAAKQASIFKYRHRPYLYSLHFDVALNGGTVLRPVFFEFPDDSNTFDIEEQFMWGEAIMVVPVVRQKTVNVSAYLPNARWYSLRDEDYGAEMAAGKKVLSAPNNESVPVLIRGGYSIPRQVPKPSATARFADPFDLLIALDNDGQAGGQLYWDDGESVVQNFTSHRFYHFSFSFSSTTTKSTLEIIVLRPADFRIPSLNVIEIFGSDLEPDFATFKLNDGPTAIDLSKSYWDRKRNLTHIEGVLLVDLQSSVHDILTWERKSASSTVNPTDISAQATTASSTNTPIAVPSPESSPHPVSTSSLPSTSKEPSFSTPLFPPTSSTASGETTQPSPPPATQTSTLTQHTSAETSSTAPPETSPSTISSSPSTQEPSTDNTSSGQDSSVVPLTTFDTRETTSNSESTTIRISTEPSPLPTTSITTDEEISIETTSLVGTTSSTSAAISPLPTLTFAFFANTVALSRDAL